MSKKHYYITTAIDYVNSSPHIGTAYEKIGADVLARWQRFLGNEVHFQMGNDEHSINVQKSAAKAGLAPKEYCDQMREKFESTWKQLNISYDGFIQTSEKHHKKGVQKLFQAILDSGDIYQSRYEGWYCESCEAYYTEKDLVNEVCPNHQSKPKWVSEENYFFALKKYNDRILKHLEKNPDFIQPEIRRNEILSLLREGLEDVSVSRSSFDWGIQLPNDNKHVVYVWFDALINYITAIGYGWDEKQFKKWWPAKHHIIGKDITRFHCVIWPAMLMSAGIKLPKTIFGHGFVSFKGEKMSKSLGNVVTPLDVVNLYGADSLRYYLMREGSFGRDSDFTWDNFINRYNGDLANGFGNLLSRTIGMAVRYQAGKIRTPNKKYIGEAEKQLADKTSALFSQVDQCIATSANDINFHTALAHIWEGMAAADRYINEYKPWELAKNEEWEKINCVLYHVAENLRISTLLLNAFIPETAAKAWQALGLSEFSPINAASATEAKTWGEIKQEITVQKGIGLFPRIEEKKPAEQAKKTKEKKVEVGTTDLIGIADFAKVELRVAEITEAEKIEDADKLLKLQVNLGEETRQLVAGIAKYYSPADLVGKKVIVVANLKPAKLRGVESQGMLLAASDKNGLTIVSPLNEITVGAKVK